MPQVTFVNTKQVCEARIGESILDVALNNGVPMEHACGGFCACATCHVEVLTGIENVSPVEEDEKERLEQVHKLTPYSRLGCQAKVQGDVVIDIQNLI